MNGRKIAALLGLIVLVAAFTMNDCNWLVDRPSQCIQKWFTYGR